MKIGAQLVLASKSKSTGVVLTTMVLRYPRSILAEVNTHRMLSRNAASSRAIPAKKMRSRIWRDPFVPVSLGRNQKGMQAGEELTGWRRFAILALWRGARFGALATSWAVDVLGAHKQLVNRLTEPWMFVEQLVTATDWNNLLKLRDHPAAEPHFQLVAADIRRILKRVDDAFLAVEANPSAKLGPDMQLLSKGEWHAPFLGRVPKDSEPNVDVGLRVATARAARVSYFLPDGTTSSEKDAVLAQRLSANGHWSPFEHVATPTATADYTGNFRGWKQYRKLFPGEDGQKA